jgi:hypothetical protein
MTEKINSKGLAEIKVKRKVSIKLRGDPGGIAGLLSQGHLAGSSVESML